MIREKILSFVLVSAMLVSVTSCSIFQKVDPQDVIDAAKSFAKSVSSLDCKKILKNVEDMDDIKADEFYESISLNNMNSSERELKQTIANTIEYKVDTDSVKIKKDTAYCDVEFTIVNYAAATSDLTGNSDVFIDAIKSYYKTSDYMVTLEFVKSDDEWLVTANCLDNLDDLYSFVDYEFDYYHVDVNSFKEISENDFIKALETIGIQESDTEIMSNTSFSFEGDNTYFRVEYSIDAYVENGNYYSYTRCVDEATAKALFNYYFNDYDDFLDSNDFSGIRNYEIVDNRGYLLIEGEYDDRAAGTYTPYHDAIFLKGNTVIFVVAGDYDLDVEREIDTFFNTLGYPHP